MLRIHGNRDSLLAALTALWADQQLRIPQAHGLGTPPTTQRYRRPKGSQARNGSQR